MAHRSIVIAAVVLGSIVMGPARPAAAQERTPDNAEIRMTLPAALFSTTMPNTTINTPVADAAPASFKEVRQSSVLSHSLVSLYASTAAMQALDVHSTLQVISRGGVEGNPMLSGVVSHKAAFVAIKMGVAVSTIMAARQVAKHNKLAAVVTLVALNSVYAAVVSHNYQLARQLR